jgi:ribosomal protein S16
MSSRKRASRAWSFEPNRLQKVVEESGLSDGATPTKTALQLSTDRRNQAWTNLVQSGAKTTDSMHQILMEIGIVEEE